MKQTEAILGDMRFIPLKGVVLILILILTTSRIHAQYALGATGQMMIPTAEMQETGTFMGSANFLPEEVTPNKFNYPTMNYSVDMSLFSFVELTYRMTLLKMRTYNGRVGYHNQDRSNTIRIRPLKESRYFPAVVIGADDLFTEKATQYWGDYYGVLTKTFGFCKGHQLAVTAGWYFHQGNQPAFKKGPFGGYWWLAKTCLFLAIQPLIIQLLTKFCSVRQIPEGTKTGQNHRKIKSRTPCSEYPYLNICYSGAKVQICPVKNESKRIKFTSIAHFLFSCTTVDNTNRFLSRLDRLALKSHVKICFVASDSHVRRKCVGLYGHSARSFAGKRKPCIFKYRKLAETDTEKVSDRPTDNLPTGRGKSRQMGKLNIYKSIISR